MRVLLVSPLPPPVGGIASWTVNLLNYLSPRSDGCEVIHLNTASKHRKQTKDHLLGRLFFGIIESKGIIDDLRANIKEHRPDVIHLTSTSSFALLKDYFIIKLAEENNIPVIVHWRFGRIPSLAAAHGWEWKSLCFIVRRSQTSIVLDAKSYGALVDAGFSNIEIIPNPIGLEVEQGINRDQAGPSRRQPGRLVFAGHVVRSKGVFELVEACSQIPLVEELVFIGPYEKNLKKELSKIAGRRDNGIWLKFLGTLTKDQVLEQMSNSPILVLPSYTEGCPNVVIEALAMGCAVIATDVGAIPELLGIKTKTPGGVCVPARNIEKLIEAIFELVQDPNKAEAMGKVGIERVLNNYTLEKVVKKYRAVWEKAGNQRPLLRFTPDSL